MKNHIGLFTSFLYPKSIMLDSIFKTIMQNYYISGCTATKYMIIITFTNKDNVITISAWNANKWHSWLSSGYMELNGKEVYRWDNERPARKTMNLLLQKLLEFNTNNIIKL